MKNESKFLASGKHVQLRPIRLESGELPKCSLTSVFLLLLPSLNISWLVFSRTRF